MTTTKPFTMIADAAGPLDEPIGYRLTPKAYAYFAVACRVRGLAELVRERLVALRGPPAAASFGPHAPRWEKTPPLSEYLADLVKP